MSSITFGHLKAGFDSVRNDKMRSFWTVLGVIIGVASVITIVSIGDGIKQQIAGQIHQLGKDSITIIPSGNSDNTSSAKGLGIFAGIGSAQPMDLNDINNVKSAKGVGAVAPLTVINGNVKGDNGVYDKGFVIGTTADLPGLLNQSLAYGSFFNEEEYGTNVAVIGKNISNEMFNVNVPLGHSFKFRGQEFIVRGIFNEFSGSAINQQADFNNAIFIPNDVGEAMTKNTAPTYQIIARASDSSKTQEVANNIQKSLDKSHGGDSNISVLVGNQNVANSDNILTLLTRLIAGIAAISLLVSGIGIMNVMLVTVSERKHEIGIRKAVGATNRQILSQFMLESSVLTLIGGILGIILAFIIKYSLIAFTDLKPIISWEIVVIATGVSLLVGVVFGSVPAFKAARKDPIEALRAQ